MLSLATWNEIGKGVRHGLAEAYLHSFPIGLHCPIYPCPYGVVMQTYTLSFTVSTTADQSALLDALIEASEAFCEDFESMHDIQVHLDEDSPCVAHEEGNALEGEVERLQREIRLMRQQYFRRLEERDAMWAALERLQAWGKSAERATMANLADIIHDANAAIAKAKGCPDA